MNRAFVFAALVVGALSGIREANAAANPRDATLVVPGSVTLVSVDVSLEAVSREAVEVEWIEAAGTRRMRAALLSSPGRDGSVATDRRRLASRLPTPAEGELRFQLGSSTLSGAGPASFRFEAVDDAGLGLWEGEKPVWVYNHGVRKKAGVPADRNRSTYIHPLYGLDGEVLTDDFPADHYHHRGLFWAWPHVRTGGREYDLWTIIGVHQRFERWIARETVGQTALLAVENGWYAGDQKILQERVWILVHAADDQARCIDLEFFWIPGPSAVTLAGAQDKSYGGLTMRYAPHSDAVITTPLGTGSADLEMTPLPWADYSGRWEGIARPSGAALFIHPGHPDYPPTWLTRHYGALCIGWPGVEARTFTAGQPIHCRYRVWVHRGMATQEALAAAYATYLAEAKARWD